MEWAVHIFIVLVVVVETAIVVYERREARIWQEKYRQMRAEAAMWEQTARKREQK